MVSKVLWNSWRNWNRFPFCCDRLRICPLYKCQLVQLMIKVSLFCKGNSVKVRHRSEVSSSKIHSPEAGYKGKKQNVQKTRQGFKQNYQLSVGKTPTSKYLEKHSKDHASPEWLLDWLDSVLRCIGNISAT